MYTSICFVVLRRTYNILLYRTLDSNVRFRNMNQSRYQQIDRDVASHSRPEVRCVSLRMSAPQLNYHSGLETEIYLWLMQFCFARLMTFKNRLEIFFFCKSILKTRDLKNMSTIIICPDLEQHIYILVEKIGASQHLVRA